MKHIEQSDVAGECRDWPADILKAKIDVPIARRRDATSLSDFSSIEIEPEDPLLATAFTQVKREEAQPAADIQDWFVRAAKQFAGGRINGIAGQFTRHITPEPELREESGHAPARRLVFTGLVSPVFHLLRIIALATLIHGRLFF